MSRPVVVHLLGRLSRGGGVQVVVRRLATAIGASEIDMHIVTIRPPWDDVTDVPATVHAIGFGGSRYRLRNRLSIAIAAAKWVWRLRPDVVQLHSGIAWLGFLARVVAPRTAFLLEVHDAPGSGRHGAWTDRIEGWMVRFLGVTAVCHSDQVSQALVETSHIPAAKIRQFPLGVDTRVFSPGGDAESRAWRIANGVDPEAVVAIAVGRSVPSKRFDLAIEAVLATRRNGTDMQLVIVGVGADAELAQLVVELNAEADVFLLDSLFDDDLAAALSACDILSSTSEYEGFGLTLIEGMACGLPVVAMAVGGVTDIVVDSETGYLIAPGDVDAFSARLVELAGAPALRDQMGSSGRTRAEERFGAKAVAAMFVALYREISGTQYCDGRASADR